jgi:hypothetical protein
MTSRISRTIHMANDAVSLSAPVGIHALPRCNPSLHCAPRVSQWRRPRGWPAGTQGLLARLQVQQTGTQGSPTRLRALLPLLLLRQSLSLLLPRGIVAVGGLLPPVLLFPSQGIIPLGWSRPSLLLLLPGGKDLARRVRLSTLQTPGPREGRATIPSITRVINLPPQSTLLW